MMRSPKTKTPRGISQLLERLLEQNRGSPQLQKSKAFFGHGGAPGKVDKLLKIARSRGR